MAESIKSIFKPKKPKKYKGDITNIICRSSWERRFCNYCDLNENIVEWGSEEFWIPYLSPVDKTFLTRKRLEEMTVRAAIRGTSRNPTVQVRKRRDREVNPASYLA